MEFNSSVFVPQVPMINEQLISEIQENKFINRLHSILLILAMLAILGVVGLMTFGFAGFVISVVFVLLSCSLGPGVTTAWIMRMYKASEIHHQQAPELYATFAELATRAELEYSPRLYYIPTRMPNAFATGHGKTAAVAVTDGLLRMMNRREIEGILAHEMAHLMHRDTKVMALADTITRITSTASRIGFFLILFSGFVALLQNELSVYYFIAFGVLFFSPTIMILLQLALSRSREFNADLGAVQLTGDAVGLASALGKLERLTKRANFWQRIFQPGPRRSQPAFLRTHPPTVERIDQLMEHADQDQVQQLQRQQTESKIDAERQPRRVVVAHPRIRPRPRYRYRSGMWH